MWLVPGARALMAWSRVLPKLAVTLVKSPIGYRPAARATVAALGLRRINQTVVVSADAPILGMIAKVPFLLRVEETPETTSTTKSGRSRAGASTDEPTRDQSAGRQEDSSHSASATSGDAP